MNNRILLIVLIISVAINLATVVTLGFRLLTDLRPRLFEDRFNEKRIEMHHRHLAREIGLKKEQVEKLDRMRETMAETMRPIQQEIMVRRHELINLLKQPDPDTARAAELLKEITMLQTQHERKAFEMFMKVKEMLTPEQQEKMEAILNVLTRQCPVPDRSCPPAHPGPPPPGQ